MQLRKTCDRATDASLKRDLDDALQHELAITHTRMRQRESRCVHHDVVIRQQIQIECGPQCSRARGRARSRSAAVPSASASGSSEVSAAAAPLRNGSRNPGPPIGLVSYQERAARAARRAWRRARRSRSRASPCGRRGSNRDLRSPSAFGSLARWSSRSSR